MPPNNRPCCKFIDSHGNECQEMDMGHGFCFWHDPNFDKTNMELTEKLERFARNGGILQGLQLKRANLKNINLVNKGKKHGFDLSGSDLYRANLSGAHLFNLKLQEGSLMKANVCDANLHCANLINSNLLGVKLHNTKIDYLVIGDSLKQEQIAKEARQDKEYEEVADNLEQAEEIYRNLRKTAEDEGLFEQAGKFLYRELTIRRLRMPKYSFKRLTSKLVDWLCGYGEKPSNTVAFSGGFIFICAVIYFLFGVQYGEEMVQLDPSAGLSHNLRNFALTIYYSVVTFSTLGYGDIVPVGITRFFAACEAFIGSFTIALFVVVFVKRMTR